MGRFDAEELLSWSHQQDIDHRSKSTACHPHAEVVHVTNQHLTTQRLPKERGHRHGGALDPSPTVEESERRTGQTRCERVREPVVQAWHLRDPVELVGNVFNANRLTVQRRDVVVDAVDLVRVDAHEALLRQLRAEGPARVGGRDDFRIRDLCAMLGDTDGARDVCHGLFHAIRTRAKGQQHLSETQDYLGLMGEAVVRRHALGEYLVAPPVAVRPSRMCRSDHASSIPCQEAKCGRHKSVRVSHHNQTAASIAHAHGGRWLPAWTRWGVRGGSSGV